MAYSVRMVPSGFQVAVYPTLDQAEAAVSSGIGLYIVEV